MTWTNRITLAATLIAGAIALVTYAQALSLPAHSRERDAPGGCLAHRGSLNPHRTVPRRSVTLRTARARPIRHHRCRW